MPRLTPQQLAARRQEFHEDAGTAVDQMLDNGDRNGIVTFEQREDRACELGDALTRRLHEEHLTADDAAGPLVEAPCPICGRPAIPIGVMNCHLANRVLHHSFIAVARKGPLACRLAN